MHQLTSNAIIQIGRFIWAVSSCRGHPTAEVFTKYYDLHYQQKKIKRDRSEEALNAQFGCITIHPSRYGDRVKLTPALKNKWSGGWARKWFYYQVPLHKSSPRGKGIYLLHSGMNALDCQTEAPHSCATDDVNAMTFEEATKII
jgi:hypothetical protein